MCADGGERTILCLNSGSSSLKLHVYEMAAAEALVARGSIEGIEQGSARLRLLDAAGDVLAAHDLGDIGHAPAIDRILSALAVAALPPVEAVGHRIVHGGPRHVAPELLTPELVADLRALAAWAPLHIPASLRVVDALCAQRADLPQVACFDTAFHARMPELARRLAIPRRFFDQGVRRYGFHGLSYEYILGHLGARARGRVVIAHLGNGASMAACLDGRPMDTTMGMTPLGGFMMGTRSGDLDPGVVFHLARDGGRDVSEIKRLLEHESGLLGVSGVSADMKTLLARRSAGDAACAQAVEMFAWQARRTVGALAAVLGGLDLLVFTAGIGEHAAEVRAMICDGLAHLGIVLDPARNDAHSETISAATSGCVVLVVPTNEEIVIARHTRDLVFGSGGLDRPAPAAAAATAVLPPDLANARPAPSQGAPT